MAVVLAVVLVSLSACVMPKTSRKDLGYTPSYPTKKGDRVERKAVPDQCLDQALGTSCRSRGRPSFRSYAGQVGGGNKGEPVVRESVRGLGRSGRVLARRGGATGEGGLNDSAARGAVGRGRGEGQTSEDKDDNMSSKGWSKQIVKEGKGKTPKAGESVTVHCTGYGKNRDLSKPFWSTKDPGQKPFSFVIGQRQVIPAWDEGVMTMKIGERAEITASPECAYGAKGFPSWGILGNSTLKFDIELLSTKPGKVRASHILVKHEESRRLASWKDENGTEIKKRTVAQADEILQGYLAQINSAPDKKKAFGAIATKNSDCSSGPRNAGDLGFFGPGEMQKAFEDGAFALEVGEISGIIHSGSGSHIIMRTG